MLDRVRSRVVADAAPGGTATLAIGDGDLVEVDGTNGKVTILKRAAELAAS